MRAWVLTLFMLCALPAHAADIRLQSAWMRPAWGGTDARAYVDIHSDEDLTLIGATTPFARSVQLVAVTNTDGSDAGRIVKRLPVAAGTPTRLAFKGNHLRLIGLKRDVPSGTTVPVTLQFTAKGGKRHTAKADLQVRGITAPEPPPAPATAANPRKAAK